MSILLALLIASVPSPLTPHKSAAPEGVEVIKKWIEDHPEGIQQTIDKGNLEVYIGSCVENPHYWSVTGGEQKIYLSFGPEVHDNFGLEALRENLRYANLHFKIPVGDGWIAGINNYTPFRVEKGGLTVEDYADGRISLLIEQPAVELSALNVGDPTCVSQNAHGKMPPGCHSVVSKMQVPTSIRINLPIPVPGEGCESVKK